MDLFNMADNDALMIHEEYDPIYEAIKKNVKTVEAFNWSW